MRRRLKPVFIALFAAGWLGSLPATRADEATDLLLTCRGDADPAPADSVAACTRLIPYMERRDAQGALYHFRAMAYEKLDEHAKAIADYTAAIERIPDQPELTPLFFLARGIQYTDVSDRDAAIGDFRMVLQLDPPNEDLIDEAKEWLSSLHAEP